MPQPTRSIQLQEQTRLQLESIANDRPGRLVACTASYLVSLLLLPSIWTFAAFALYVACDLAAIPFEHRLLRRDFSRSLPGYLLCCGGGSAGFAAVPVIVMYHGALPCLLFGLVILWSIITHCVVLRTLDARIFAVSAGPAVLGHLALLGPLLRDGAPASAILGVGAIVLVSAVYVASAALTGFRLNRDLCEARLRADDASHAKDRFLAAISHEIRTPLNGILGIAQLMQSDARTAREIRDAEVLLSSGVMLKSIVDDVLDHAKMESGKFTIRPEDTNLRRTVRTALRLFETPAAEKGLSLEVEIDDGVPAYLSLDPLRLKQILSNLISNAIKFTETGGVRVTARLVPGNGRETLAIDVADTGAGIPAAALGQLFTPFGQLDSAAARAGIGTGLGLVIARNLARLMEGDLEVRSAPGSGTVFTLSLPVRRARALVGAGTDGPASDPVPTLDGAVVLVVDDNATNRMVACAFLRRDGAEVIEAGDGSAALDALRGSRVDLVLMDIHMPGMPGHEAVREIRGDPGLSGVPVIALTAASGSDDRDTYMSDGFDGFLSKPLSRLTMQTEIARLMTARPAAPVSADRPSPAPAPH